VIAKWQTKENRVTAEAERIKGKHKKAQARKPRAKGPNAKRKCGLTHDNVNA